MTRLPTWWAGRGPGARRGWALLSLALVATLITPSATSSPASPDPTGCVRTVPDDGRCDRGETRLIRFGQGWGTDARLECVCPYAGQREWVPSRMVALSPDGRFVYATGWSCIEYCGDGRDFLTAAFVRSTGRVQWMRRYDGGRSWDHPTSMALSPDGRRLFVTGITGGGGDRVATVAYDALTGRQLWRESSLAGWTWQVTVSRDGGRVFVTSSSGTIALRASNGSRVWRSLNRLQDAWAVRAAPDPRGHKLYVVGSVPRRSSTNWGDLQLVVFDGRNGRVLARGRYDAGPLDYPSAVAVTPDGSRVIVTGMTARNGDYDSLTSEYETVAFSPAGKLLWARRYSGPWTDGYNAATALAISPDGRRVFVTGMSQGGITPCAFCAGPEDFDYATLAYDAGSGRTLWESRVATPLHNAEAATDVFATSSRVYVTGISGIGNLVRTAETLTVAYSAADGSTQWAAHLDDQFSGALSLVADRGSVVVLGTYDAGDRYGYRLATYPA